MAFKNALRMATIRMAAGGTLLAWFGFGGLGNGGLGSCVSNAALDGFYTNVGHAVIDTAAESAGAVGGDVNNIVIQPTAGFFRNLWTTFVDVNIPQDPVFERLLVE